MHSWSGESKRTFIDRKCAHIRIDQILMAKVRFLPHSSHSLPDDDSRFTMSCAPRSRSSSTAVTLGRSRPAVLELPPSCTHTCSPPLLSLPDGTKFSHLLCEKDWWNFLHPLQDTSMFFFFHFSQDKGH